MNDQVKCRCCGKIPDRVVIMPGGNHRCEFCAENCTGVVPRCEVRSDTTVYESTFQAAWA